MVGAPLAIDCLSLRHSRPLCFSVTPAGSNADGSGGATSCAPFVGVPTVEIEGSSKMTITFLSGAAGTELPAYITGPVIDKASTVEIEFGTGEVLRLPTFSGPASLGSSASMRRNCRQPSQYPCPV